MIDDPPAARRCVERPEVVALSLCECHEAEESPGNRQWPKPSHGLSGPGVGDDMSSDRTAGPLWELRLIDRDRA